MNDKEKVVERYDIADYQATDEAAAFGVLYDPAFDSGDLMLYTGTYVSTSLNDLLREVGADEGDWVEVTVRRMIRKMPQEDRG